MNLVFDTSVLSGYLRAAVPVPEETRALIEAAVESRTAYISTISVFEIQKGLNKVASTRKGKALAARAHDLLINMNAVSLTAGVAGIAADLVNRSSQLPELCDVFIAATAILVYGELCTADERALPFFRTHVPELPVRFVPINVR